MTRCWVLMAFRHIARQKMLGENAAAVHMRLFHAHASIVQVHQSESLRGQQGD